MTFAPDVNLPVRPDERKGVARAVDRECRVPRVQRSGGWEFVLGGG